MHPAAVIVPAAVLVLGPRLWVKYVLDRYDKTRIRSGSAAEVARELLDRHGLESVKVECTDIGDHYDPEDKAVRISRKKYNAKTLTAVTTAAHEVGHAVQDAAHYPPFVWRGHLVRVARIVGEAGSLVLLSVPLAAVSGRQPAPPAVIGLAILGVLGTAMAVQLVTLPTEFDASFNKATPMLMDGYVPPDQIGDAKKILFACSLTYVASSLTSVISVWPWLPRRAAALLPDDVNGVSAWRVGVIQEKTSASLRVTARKKPRGLAAAVVRMAGKPLIRGWFRLTRVVDSTA